MIAQTVHFAQWLNTELADRGWSFRELSRRSGISTTQISDIANQKASPGLDSCVSIARALNLPPEDILRRAGKLPPLPQPVAEEHEALSLLRRLPAAARQLILTQLRALAGAQPSPTYTINEDTPSYVGAQHAAPIPDPDPLTTELLDQFRQLPEEWQQEAIREIERLRRYSTYTVRIIGDENETQTSPP